MQRLRREYSFNADEEAAFLEVLDEKMHEGIVSPVPHTYPKFSNPVFMVPEEGNRWRKVVDCSRLNQEQTFQRFRMEGAEVVQQITLPDGWATSLDIKSAFNHIRMSKQFRPFLCFEHQGSYYAYNAMPLGCRHSPRVFALECAWLHYLVLPGVMLR
jgi:hypothetical protein